MMKKMLFILLLSAGYAVSANAQAKKPLTKMPRPLAQQLQLTADQQMKIDAIYKAHAEKVDSLNAHPGRGVQRERKLAMTTMIGQIESVLTSDQKKSYVEFRAKQQEKNLAKKAGTDATAKRPPER